MLQKRKMHVHFPKYCTTNFACILWQIYFKLFYLFVSLHLCLVVMYQTVYTDNFKSVKNLHWWIYISHSCVYCDENDSEEIFI